LAGFWQFNLKKNLFLLSHVEFILILLLNKLQNLFFKIIHQNFFIMRKLVLFALSIFLFGSVMAQFDVTMNVDMNGVADFDPATHDVYVTGNPWGWPEPGSNADLKLTPTAADPMIYTITANVAEPMEIQYKYATTMVAGWDGTEWAGDPNRHIYVTEETVMNDVYGEKPAVVTFKVDMTAAEVFDPATDEIFMAGNINYPKGWVMPGETPNMKMMPETEGSMVYILTVTIPNGDYEYKYFRVINGEASWDNGEWAGGDNRMVTISGDVTIADSWGAVAEEMMIVDFEDGTTGPLTLHVMGNGDWDNEELHPVSETFEVIDNPDPSGINTSAKVMKFNRRGMDEDGQPWGGFWANVDPAVDVTTFKYVHVMVWKPRISPVKFKLEGGPSGTLELVSSNEQTKVDTWVDMVFKFDTMTGTYPVIAFMPDFEDPFTAPELQVIYFDNIRINNDSTAFGDTFIFNPVKNSSLAVYPNPTTSALYIDLDNNAQSIGVYNLLGQQQAVFNNVSAGTFSFSTSDLPRGIYMVVMRDKNNKQYTAKFVKE
jgi:hypothetical protein